jgi:hypothetical protein
MNTSGTPPGCSCGCGNLFDTRAYSVEKITPIIIVKVYSVSSMHHHQFIARVFDKIIVSESTNMKSVLINFLVDAGLS